MKKLFFVFMMTAFAANIFASEGGSCTNKPGSNDGICATVVTANGEVKYYCIDAGWQSKNCVKSNTEDEG